MTRAETGNYCFGFFGLRAECNHVYNRIVEVFRVTYNTSIIL